MRPQTGAARWADVGAAVRDRMTALGTTPGELARTTGLSAATIRGVLRGSGRRQRWTLSVLSRALDWPFGYLAAIAEGGAPPPAAQAAPEAIPAGALAASVPPPAVHAAPLAALIGLADLGQGASLQAEANATAARLAREISQEMTAAERIALHQFLTKVADEIRWPRF